MALLLLGVRMSSVLSFACANSIFCTASGWEKPTKKALTEHLAKLKKMHAAAHGGTKVNPPTPAAVPIPRKRKSGNVKKQKVQTGGSEDEVTTMSVREISSLNRDAQHYLNQSSFVTPLDLTANTGWTNSVKQNTMGFPNSQVTPRSERAASQMASQAIKGGLEDNDLADFAGQEERAQVSNAVLEFELEETDASSYAASMIDEQAI
jgi:hypothetical protein